jgi:hypothetical protein
VVGLNASATAVAHAGRRGVRAIRRVLFGASADADNWRPAVLAAGNIGIGGNPVCLLRRVAGFVHPRGSTLVEIGPGAKVRAVCGRGSRLMRVVPPGSRGLAGRRRCRFGGGEAALRLGTAQGTHGRLCAVLLLTAGTEMSAHVCTCANGTRLWKRQLSWR